MYIGIDLGTSGVKAILLDEEQHILATASHVLPISRPQPLWSEQHPQDWWNATNQAMQELASQYDLRAVKAIGLTGQMHGATLLDKADNVLSPAILWNDGRSFAECAELEQLVQNSREITGNLMMPGFTAPKLKWIAKHQPNLAAQVAKVLLPKDYLRLLMTGEYASDMSDASGTMWLDVGKRDWNQDLLNACGLDINNMPQLFEGNQITGYLRKEIAQQWQMNAVPVVAGGGDNAAGAIGVGLYQSGQAMLSLGTSGVYFVVTDKFRANPQKAVHSFCHALPNRWHLMSVILSAASAVDWAKKVTGI
ncbi:xylulokinase, partial [[Pasteurella] aerogenes]|nr:xylulokinase [[Pasteurella] aerogenes]